MSAVTVSGSPNFSISPTRVLPRQTVSRFGPSGEVLQTVACSVSVSVRSIKWARRSQKAAKGKVTYAAKSPHVSSFWPKPVIASAARAIGPSTKSSSSDAVRKMRNPFRLRRNASQRYTGTSASRSTLSALGRFQSLSARSIAAYGYQLRSLTSMPRSLPTSFLNIAVSCPR